MAFVAPERAVANSAADPVADPAADPAAAAREALCRRCGRCCCRKLLLGQTVFYTPFFCRHLGPPKTQGGRVERRCTVYAERFRMNLRCRDAADGARMGLFPADCPYVAGRADYVPPVADWLTHPTVRAAVEGRLAPEVFDELAAALEVAPEALRAELARARPGRFSVAAADFNHINNLDSPPQG